MGEKDSKPNIPPSENQRHPSYLSIPDISRPGNHKSSPNSGPEYNPVLERGSSWFDRDSETIQEETVVFSQQDTQALRVEPDESSSQAES